MLRLALHIINENPNNWKEIHQLIKIVNNDLLIQTVLKRQIWFCERSEDHE